MQVNIEGQMVKYVMDIPECISPLPEYVALITKDYSGQGIYAADYHYFPEESDGVVMLHVFTENRTVVKDHVPYSAEKLPNTWHWNKRLLSVNKEQENLAILAMETFREEIGYGCL